MISVMLVDDHEMVVKALSQIVETNSNIQVVSLVGDAASAWQFLSQKSVDVVVTDLDLPGESGRQLAVKILEKNPNQGIVVLSYRVEPEEVHFLIESGVRGYVPKSAPVSELDQAIRLVAAGNEYFSSQVVRALTTSMRSEDRPNHKLLSLKQTVILQFIAQGLTTRQIAEEIHMSPKTVEKYRGEIFRRLNCKNHLQALDLARRLNILS
ncbi:response regulator transcription factor [bacterium]|nr:response regulator transcription factor [bacterium]